MGVGHVESISSKVKVQLLHLAPLTSNGDTALSGPLGLGGASSPERAPLARFRYCDVEGGPEQGQALQQVLAVQTVLSLAGPSTPDGPGGVGAGMRLSGAFGSPSR